MKNDPRQQPYDGALKGLFEKHATLIIPYLLPMVRLEATPLVEDEDDEAEEKTEKENKAEKKEGAELNIEINRSTLKADLLYRAFYNLDRIILVVELQTRDDEDLQRRLMAYHGSLHLKYNKPVVILVIYVFEDGPEDLSYQDTCDGEVLATIHPKVIRLRDLDSEQIVREHQVPFYTLLPATNKPGVQLLKQALQEMHEYHNKQDLSEHLIWFQTILGRTKTISKEEKQSIEEVLKVQYQIDPLIRENPTVVSIVAEARAEAKAEGRAEGEIKGKVEGLQEGILAIVSNRFSVPAISQIRQTITSSQNVEQLQKFLSQVAQASDEQEALALLAQCFPHQNEIDSPITENPAIRAMVAEGEAKGIRNSILDFVSARFSSVAAQVQQTIAPIQDAQLLRKFNRQLVRASNEQEVYALLAECFPTH